MIDRLPDYQILSSLTDEHDEIAMPALPFSFERALSRALWLCCRVSRSVRDR
jgi:hypothetical protein